MKDKRLWFLAGGIVLIISALLFLNFRLAVSNTENTKTVITTSAGDDKPISMQNKKISIVLVGEGPLANALRKALAEKMDKAGMGQIELVQGREPAYQNPILVVKVATPGLIWTPFFAISQFSIHAGYSSTGDSNYVDLVEKSHTTTGYPDRSILNMYAEYEVKDRSLGLISRPGYNQYLADYFAQEIVSGLKDLYNW